MKVDRNLVIPADDLAFIRSLGDFDLTMLLSEVNDHGWAGAITLLPDMRTAIRAARLRELEAVLKFDPDRAARAAAKAEYLALTEDRICTDEHDR